MIKLNDYVDGKIDVEMGKSPIILTFDDGNENNFKVLGEENGELAQIIEQIRKKKVLKNVFVKYGLRKTFLGTSMIAFLF